MFWAYIYAYFIDKDSAARLKDRTPPTLKEKLEVLPRILPFLAIVVGVLYVLYGGVATPSEASGVGAFLVFVMIAVVYKIYQPKENMGHCKNFNERKCNDYVYHCSLIYSYY